MWAPVPPRTRCVARLISHTIFILLSARTLPEERKVHVAGLGFYRRGDGWVPKGVGTGWQVGNLHSLYTLHTALETPHINIRPLTYFLEVHHSFVQ